jgi:hypothetical protein
MVRPGGTKSGHYWDDMVIVEEKGLDDHQMRRVPIC